MTIMKNILKVFLFAALSTVALTGCQSDELSSQSIFANGMGNTIKEKTDFDKWLEKNFVGDYNISLNYFYNDKESNQTYNVTPADYDKAKALAWIIKYVWLDAYTEAMGGDKTFLRTYTPRVIQLSGSYMWKSNDSQVMGTAEQGMKIMLYGVNELDLDNPRFVSDNPYESHAIRPIDMNHWFFETMHHEFCHILTQKKNYSLEYQNISNGTYHATDWVNIKDTQAAKEGFVTGYASSEYNEDFAETYAMYISYSKVGWDKIITQAGKEGAAKIIKKLEMQRKYFNDSWNIDLDKMRDIVQRRCTEVSKMDIKNLDYSL